MADPQIVRNSGPIPLESVIPPSNYKVAKPYPEFVTAAASTNKAVSSWKKIWIDRVSYSTIPAGARGAWYQNHPPTATDIDEGTTEYAPDGKCYFLSRGDWWVRIQRTADATPETVVLVIHDGSSASPLQQQQAADASTVSQVNLVQVAGTAQTPADVSGTYVNRSAWKTDQLVAVSAVTILAYATSRAVPNGKRLGFGALKANIGTVYVCDSAGTKLTAITLAPGQAGGSLQIDNWNLVNIYADNVGDGIWLGAEV